MLRSCPNCGRSVKPTLLRQGLCPQCLRTYPRRFARETTGRWSPDRDGQAQARFRQALRIRAQDRCEYLENGLRCTVTRDLQAHHDRPGYEAECGRLLCRSHHRAVDPHAR